MTIEVIKASGGSTDVSAAFMPTRLLSSEVFTIPRYKQALYSIPPDLEGYVVMDGVMVDMGTIHTDVSHPLSWEGL